MMEVEGLTRPKQSLTERKILLVMLSNVLVGSNYTVIVPLYPQLAVEVGLGPALIGVIFAFMPIGSLATSTYLAHRKSSKDKIKDLMLGCWLTVLPTQAFASFAVAVSIGSHE
jgi:hypothetical protein